MRTSKLQPAFIDRDKWAYMSASPPGNHTFRYAGWTITVHLSSICTFFRPCKWGRKSTAPQYYTANGPTVVQTWTRVLGP